MHLVASNFMEDASTQPAMKGTRYEKDPCLQFSNRVDEAHGI